MCIVSYAPKGTKKYGDKVKSFIENGYHANQQGSGYMFKRDGENVIGVRKGFFSLEGLMNAIEKEKLGDEDELVVHHRISTAGLVNEENCHPFIVSRKHEEVIATDITINKPALCHNGIFHKIKHYEDLDKDYSDTYAFTRHIMADKSMLSILDRDETLFKIVLNEILGWSRIVILFPDKPTKMIGDFVEDEGYFHSNNGYCDRTVINRGGTEYGGSRHWDNRSYSSYVKNATNAFAHQTLSDQLKHYKKNKVEEVTEGPATYKMIKLDSTTIELTSKNSHHFYFVSKSKYDFWKKNMGTAPRYGKILSSFDPDSATNTICTSVNGGSSYEAFATESIIEDYYYVPTKEFFDIYLDYTILINTPLEDGPGKQTIKKIDKMLNNNINKKNDDLVYYKRFDKKFRKQALSLFKKHLEGKMVAKKRRKLVFVT